MHENELGIVLKHAPGSSHKISVLTTSYGKMMTVILDHRIMQRIQSGALIQLHGGKLQGNILVPTNTSLLSIPIPRNTHDLYWLHHLLELCYFFLPLHQPVRDVFMLLQHSCIFATLDHADDPGWDVFKKNIVGAFMILFGFFPPESLKKPLYAIKNSLLLFIDFDPEQKVEFVTKHMRMVGTIPLAQLNAWLITCIKTHPRMKAFKTLDFVYKSSTTV